MFIIVRTAGDPLAFAGSVAAAMQRVDPDQPLAEVTSMDSLAARSLATPGFGAALAIGFAAIALLLTMVGMYGLFAWTVTQRRREIGVRLALGGQPHAIVATFMRDGLTIAAAGLIAGLSVAFIVSRAARSLLPTSGSLDLVTAAITAAIVLCAISCACWIPARRASRISPMASLSAE
jgi:putative ABC transport system permease protein